MRILHVIGRLLIDLANLKEAPPTSESWGMTANEAYEMLAMLRAFHKSYVYGWVGGRGMAGKGLDRVPG